MNHEAKPEPEPPVHGRGASAREITRLLDAHAAGDREALDRLIPLVYDDLRRIAHNRLRSERASHTLDTTAVVEGRRVLVTGASRGIGRATAVRMAEDGARVAVHYATNREAAEEVRDGLPGDGHFVVGADLGDVDSLPALVDEIYDGLGRLDVLVNNAGIFELHPPMDTSFAEWRSAWERTLAVNLLGPAHLSFLVARRMVDQGGGRIVNVSSRGAFRGEPDAPAYGASKAGLNALGQSMAKALAPRGVTVCTIAPGWVDTDMADPYLSGPGAESVRNQSPLGRVATPEEVADVVAYLARPGNDSITGCIIDVNGASYLRT